MHQLLAGRQANDVVRARARELWESNGRPAGRDLEFWLQAERELGEKKKSERLTRLLVHYRSVRM